MNKTMLFTSLFILSLSSFATIVNTINHTDKPMLMDTQECNLETTRCHLDPSIKVQPFGEVTRILNRNEQLIISHAAVKVDNQMFFLKESCKIPLGINTVTINFNTDALGCSY